MADAVLKSQKISTSGNAAVVLLSGGLDSATVLYQALSKGFHVHGLIFDYGQRHKKEIRLAQALAERNNCPYQTVVISLPWKGSSLLDKTQALPDNERIDATEIPSTYVPARNIIFLSFAASYAEAIGARRVFIGANAVDYSGYPDCRPEFFEAYEHAMQKGLKSGSQGRAIRIDVPLLHKTKAQIIRMGVKLQVPYELTWSCYSGGRKPCGRCDSCRLRAKGFEEAGYSDPGLLI